MGNGLNLWKMRNITLDGEIIIFKALALSKTVYLILTISFSKQVYWRYTKNTISLYLKQLDP